MIRIYKLLQWFELPLCIGGVTGVISYETKISFVIVPPSTLLAE